MARRAPEPPHHAPDEGIGGVQVRVDGVGLHLLDLPPEGRTVRRADPELAKQYGIVGVDSDGRITSFVEKPENPPTTLCATATYIFAREHARLVDTYLADGNPPDQPGYFVGWLQAREPVYAYSFPGTWWDIGDHAQLREADNLMRRRVGLPERAAYSPQS